MTKLYRAHFTVPTPISEADYKLIISVSYGNYDKLTGFNGDYNKLSSFEDFQKITRNFTAMEFRTKPLDLETLTLLKIKFGGKIEEVKKEIDT
jgi:hypothetical protein